MQVHLTAAAFALQDNQIQSSRESLSVHKFRASNSTVFQTVSFKWKHIWSKSRRVEAHTRLVRLHAAPQRSAAAWQKQCILVRTFVRLWSALQPPYSHMCHQSTARAKRDQPQRSDAAVAQNRLRKPWWRHTLFSLVRFCDDIMCWVFILTIQFLYCSQICIFMTAKAYLVYIAQVILSIFFIKNTDKSSYTHTLLVFK